MRTACGVTPNPSADSNRAFARLLPLNSYTFRRRNHRPRPPSVLSGCLKPPTTPSTTAHLTLALPNLNERPLFPTPAPSWQRWVPTLPNSSSLGLRGCFASGAITATSPIAKATTAAPFRALTARERHRIALYTAPLQPSSTVALGPVSTRRLTPRCSGPHPGVRPGLAAEPTQLGGGGTACPL